MRKIILDIMLVICIGFFLFCGWKLYGYYQLYHTASDEYDTLTEQVVSDKKTAMDREIDFAKLQKMNPDIIGWVYIPGTRIDYPIVKGKDNEEYLHKTFNGTANNCGAIFMDKDGKVDFSAQHNIVYGHHMKDGIKLLGRDGSMFATLVDLRDQSYYKKHKYIYVYTPDKTRKLEIIAGYARPASAKLPITFGEEANQLKYYQELMSRSDISTGFKINKKKLPNLYSFITCSYEGRDNRTFIHAVENKVVEK